MSKRDEIAQALLASTAYAVPSPWLVAPGESVMMVPPNERDLIERPAISPDYDANAVMPDDVMQQYFWPAPVEEEI